MNESAAQVQAAFEAGLGALSLGGVGLGLLQSGVYIYVYIDTYIYT